jgi:hypothetical protein
MRSLAANALLHSCIHDSTIALISCDALAPLSDTRLYVLLLHSRMMVCWEVQRWGPVLRNWVLA